MLGHRRCRSRVACTSPKDVGFLGLATDLPSREVLAYLASFELRAGIRRRLSPVTRCRAAPVRSTVFHIAKDYRGVHCRLPGRMTSRPSQSDSRVVAHNERVVGNGCHTASSTRTSLGVPALQGFTSSTLLVRCYAYPPNLRLAPDFAGAPFTCLIRALAVPACASTARRESSSQGLDRWASQLKVLDSCECLPAWLLRTVAVLNYSLLSFLPLCNCQCFDGCLARLCVALP